MDEELPDVGIEIHEPGPDISAEVLRALQRAVPESQLVTRCPDTICPNNTIAIYFYPITEIIMHLNDIHGWSRERVADWLDTLDVDLRFKTQD